MKHASVIVLKKPGAFDSPLSYKVPNHLEGKLKLGQGVLVPLKDKTVRAIIVDFKQAGLDKVETLKELDSILEDLWVPQKSLELAIHISSYYKCSVLRALKLMLPSHLWKGTGVRILNKYKKDCEQEIETAAIEKIYNPESKLTPAQGEALRNIEKSTKPSLLHGVTGSGKTEIYLHLILEQVKQNKQSVLLLPEIALTPQMIHFFSRYFEGEMAVFHSKLSAGERLKNWLMVRDSKVKLVIGSRSAIFAPFKDLGLLIVDEEHEWTYKQESSPYYQIHQLAEFLNDKQKVKVVFGTATPRIETIYKAKKGVYSYVKLTQRFNNKDLPPIEVVDLREEFKRKNYSIFSHSLHKKIVDRLEKNEKMILFVNQRGVARAVMCRDCGEAINCPNCGISLKLHQANFQTQATLNCHYCGYKASAQNRCMHCQSTNIRHVGIGTQRVEQELLKAYPGIRVIRADKDTTSEKEGFKPIYDAFKSGEYDVMVGTQMVAKGHDFDQVTLIGIILADIGLHVPDFRSHERLFHLITQVSGRAGRGLKGGEVVLQTYQPNHHAIKMAAEYAYNDFIENELSFRERLSYPPFSQMIKFTVLGQNLEKLREHIQVEKEVLEDVLKLNNLEAKIMSAPAMISKIGDYFYYHVIVQTPSTTELLKKWAFPKGWRIDIDPVHTT